MSLLGRALRARGADTRSGHEWQTYAGVRFPMPTAAGVDVSDEVALRHSAVFACIRLIAGTIASLPVDVVRTRGADRLPAPEPPIVRSPSAVVSRRTWVWQVASSLVGRGNAYGMVVAVDTAGRPTQIEIVDPAVVTWQAIRGRAVPHIEGRAEDVFPAGRLWHVAGLTLPGSPVGMNPIEYAREAVGAGLAAQRFGNRFFGADAHPTGLLETDQRITPEEAEALKARFRQAVAGREFAVLGQGAKYSQLQVNPDDSQFLDLQRFTVEEVCRFFGVAPEMIGAATSGQSVTYANREQRTQDFLMFGLGPWIDAIEQAWSALLAVPQSVKFRTGGLLRADTLGRFQVYEIASRIEQATGFPVLLTSEMRALEDLPPLTAAPTDPEGSA